MQTDQLLGERVGSLMKRITAQNYFITVAHTETTSGRCHALF